VKPDGAAETFWGTLPGNVPVSPKLRPRAMVIILGRDPRSLG
jgi:hypothetical protein